MFYGQFSFPTQWCWLDDHQRRFRLIFGEGQVKVRPRSSAGPVAQSVERWTPRGERTRPGKRGPGLQARRALDIYEPPGGYGYGWWQAVAR